MYGKGRRHRCYVHKWAWMRGGIECVWMIWGIECVGIECAGLDCTGNECVWMIAGV